MAPQPPFIGRYQIRSRLGQGGMGVVYLAADPAISRLVAIKLLRTNSDDMRERFRREARIVGQLQHPNIVTVYDIGDHEGQPFIAMEFVPGETLAEVIQRRAPWSPAKKLEMIRQVCDGLEFAHRSGLVHRDIKPANLIISRHDVLKILDFGIARMVDATSTLTGGVLGTPSYMSPEQVQSKPVDLRSDVFAVGLVLYELISYRKAFPGRSQAEILHSIIHSNPASLTDSAGAVDAGLASIVDRALQKNPEARYQSLKQLRADLIDVIGRVEANAKDDTVPLGASPDAAPAQPSSAGRKSRDEFARRRGLQVATHLDAARRALDEGALDLALQAAEQAAFLDPDDVRTLGLLEEVRTAIDVRQVSDLLGQGRAQLDAAELTAAMQMLGAARDILPVSPEVRQFDRDLAAALDARDAERARRRAVAEALERARHEFRDGALESAVDAAAEALAHEPENPEALELHGAIATALEQRRAAEARDRAAREAVEGARRQFEQGAHEAALEQLRQAADHPLVDTARATLGRRFAEIQQQRRREAEEAAQRAEAERIRRARWIADRLLAARSSRDAGEYDAGIQLLREALTQDGTVAEFAALVAEIEHTRDEAARRAEIEMTAAEARAALEEEDVTLAGGRIEALRQLDPSHEEIEILERRLDTVKDAIAERRRRAEHERLAGDAIAAARRLSTSGQHVAAIAQLERFGPAHPSVDRVLVNLRTEADRIRLEQEAEERRRQAAEQARRDDERRALEAFVLTCDGEIRAAITAGRPADADAGLSRLVLRVPDEPRVAELREAIDGCRRAIAERERAEWMTARVADIEASIGARRFEDATAILASIRVAAPDEPSLDALEERLDGARARAQAEAREQWCAERVREFEDALEEERLDAAGSTLDVLEDRVAGDGRLMALRERLTRAREAVADRVHAQWCADRSAEIRTSIWNEDVPRAAAVLAELQAAAPDFSNLPSLRAALDAVTLRLEQQHELARHLADAKLALERGELDRARQGIDAARALEPNAPLLLAIQAEFDQREAEARTAREQAEQEARAADAILMARQHWASGREADAIGVLESHSPPHALVTATLTELREALAAREAEHERQDRERQRLADERHQHEQDEQRRDLQRWIAHAADGLRRGDLDDAARSIAAALLLDAQNAEALSLHRDLSRERQALVEQQRVEAHGAKVRQVIAEALRDFAAGQHDAAIDRLAHFDPANAAITRALQELRNEKRRIEAGRQADQDDATVALPVAGLPVESRVGSQPADPMAASGHAPAEWGAPGAKAPYQDALVASVATQSSVPRSTTVIPRAASDAWDHPTVLVRLDWTQTLRLRVSQGQRELAVALARVVWEHPRIQVRHVAVAVLLGAAGLVLVLGLWPAPAPATASVSARLAVRDVQLAPDAPVPPRKPLPVIAEPPSATQPPTDSASSPVDAAGGLRRVRSLIEARRYQSAADSLAAILGAAGPVPDVVAAGRDLAARTAAASDQAKVAALAAHADGETDFARGRNAEASARRLPLPDAISEIVMKYGVAETLYSQAARAALSRTAAASQATRVPGGPSPVGGAVTPGDKSARSTDPQVERHAVATALQRWKAAYESLDVAAVSAVWPAADTTALTAEFARYSSQHIDWRCDDPAIGPDRAVASCVGRVEVKAAGGQLSTRTQRFIFSLQAVASNWQVVGVRLEPGH